MEIPKLPILIIVLAFLIVSGFALIVSTRPADFGKIVAVDSENRPNTEVVNIMKGRLSSANPVDIAFPFKTIYNPTNAFSVSVGIINNLESVKQFNIVIEKENGPESDPLFIFERNAGKISPDEIKIVDIGMITYNDTLPGSYSYSIVVCEGESCSKESPGFYSSRKINFRIEV